MVILELNSADIGGGAEKVACDLHKCYRELGHESWLAVGHKIDNGQQVLDISSKIKYSAYTRSLFSARDWLSSLDQRIPIANWLSKAMDAAAQPKKKFSQQLGHEDFHYPSSRRILELIPATPDIIHAHNLHGEYFDLEFLPELSDKIPFVQTLHDEWMLTGHCAYSVNCPRWEIGCGSCPDLQIYPAIKRDATARNWRKKERIYQHSRLYIATPSKWLFDRVQRSMMRPFEGRVIRNGVDLKIFCPGERQRARFELDLPQNATIILGIASRSPFKDYRTVRDAVDKIRKKGPIRDIPTIFIALGTEKNDIQRYGNLLISNVNFVFDVTLVKKYFQAADIFLHAALAENYPNTILESFACGTPVIATSVGGIPEQVEDGVTGFLVPKGDGDVMADRITQLITDGTLRIKMGNRAADIAQERFGLDHQAKLYLTWFEEILENHASSRPA